MANPFSFKTLQVKPTSKNRTLYKYDGNGQLVKTDLLREKQRSVKKRKARR